MLVILFFMLVRWSWPRFRFDQLMSMAWKVMLPLGLVNLLAMAVLVELREQGVMAADTLWPLVGISWAVALVAWLVAGFLAPLASDNRPRAARGALDAEARLSA